MRCISFQPTEGMFFTTTPLVGACKLNHSTRLVTHCLSSSLQVWIRLKKHWTSVCAWNGGAIVSHSFYLIFWIDFQFNPKLELVIIDLEISRSSSLSVNSKSHPRKVGTNLETKWKLASVAWCMQGLNSLTLAQLTCKLKLELELKLCVPPNLNDAVPEFNTEQWLGRFLGTIGGDPSVCKSNRLHVDILWFSFIKLGYILL